jgi:hypothetical protein
VREWVRRSESHEPPPNQHAMAKGKKKNRKGDSDSDDEQAEAPAQETKELSRKELRKLKKAGVNVTEEPAAKPAGKKKVKKQRGGDSEDEEMPLPEPDPEPEPERPAAGGKKVGPAMSAGQASDVCAVEEEEQEAADARRHGSRDGGTGRGGAAGRA